MNDRKLILDVDTGIDDALALAYLATFDDVNLLGVVGTYGNVAMGKAVRNTQYVLERLGLRHIPVMRGSSHPSWAASFIPDAGCAQFHGTDGLGGFGPDASALAGMSDSGETDIPATSAPTCVSDSAESDMCSLISVGGYDVHDPHANPAADSFSLTFSSPGAANVPCSPVLSEGVRFIIDAVRRYGRNVTVVATGPLTDVDMALTAAPDIAGKLQLVMMGGTLTQEGNCWDLTAETNIIQDPEAADRVFHSGADITMIGLDVTHQCLLGGMATRRWRRLPICGRMPGWIHRRPWKALHAHIVYSTQARCDSLPISLTFPSPPISGPTHASFPQACHCMIRSPQPSPSIRRWSAALTCR